MQLPESLRFTSSSFLNLQQILLSVQGMHGGTNVCALLLHYKVCTEPKKKTRYLILSSVVYET